MLRAIALSSMTNSSALRYERKRPMPASIRQRNDLALQHLGLAGFVASRLQRQGLDDLDDLMQEARIGLLRGAERFNRQLGLKPSTYLASCARGQVLHYRRDRVPWCASPGDCASHSSRGVGHWEVKRHRTWGRFVAPQQE